MVPFLFAELLALVGDSKRCSNDSGKRRKAQLLLQQTNPTFKKKQKSITLFNICIIFVKTERLF